MTVNTPQPSQRRAPKGYALVSISGEGDNLTADVRSPDQMALTSASVQVADMQGQLSKRQVPRNRINLTKQLGAVRLQAVNFVPVVTGIIGLHKCSGSRVTLTCRATLGKCTRLHTRRSVARCWK
jgi:hypothetical protein